MSLAACFKCAVGMHSQCTGDFTSNCGCELCYGDHGRGPFYVPEDESVPAPMTLIERLKAHYGLHPESRELIKEAIAELKLINSGLGYCTVHDGVIESDTDVCDFAADDDELTDDGEPRDCVRAPLLYREGGA